MLTQHTHGLDGSRWDVVVVGARAAGASTAMLLARQGLRVLVVDRSRYGADTLSTHALMRAGVLQLHRWGLLDHVVAAGTPPVRRTAFAFHDERMVIPIKPSHGVDALYAPRRTVLDPILVDAAVAAGAEVRFGVGVTGVRHDRTGRVTGIVGRDEDGTGIEIGARLVVGADGLRSTVAAGVGAPVERIGTGAGAYVYGYWSDLVTDGYEWIFRPGAVAGVIPTDDGQACVFAGGRPADVGRGGMGVLRDLVARAEPDVAARLDTAVAPAGVRTFGGCRGYVRTSRGPGWALVGDAGYWKDPISAHGLTDALRDAELLARAITSSLGDDDDEDAALAGYQTTRDRLSAQLFDVVDVIAAQRWTEDEIGDLLLQLSAAMSAEVDALVELDAAPVA